MHKFFYSFLTVSAVFVIIWIAIVVVINTESKPYIFNDITTVPQTDVGLIPGASVSATGVLSPVLQDRANAAIKLYNKNKIEKILVSGDNSTTTYNEVNPVRIYLLKHSVADDDIYLDYAGFDTYSSMYRARDIFKVGSTTVITQSFHLPRAVFIARTLGITAYGFDADDGHYLLRNYVREYLANVKAFLNITFHTKPKYLGKIHPVDP